MSNNMESFTKLLFHKNFIPELSKLTHSLPEATKLVRVAVTELRKNEFLTTCDPDSFVGAIFQATQLNLSFDTNLQNCAIVPYQGKCQLQIMYRGFINLAHRTNLVSFLEAHIVKTKDKFHFDRVMPTGETRMIHEPKYSDRGDILGVYSIVRMKDGHIHFEFMDYDDITRARMCSQQPYKTKKGNDSVWTKHTDAMSKKTVIKQVMRYLPLGQEFASAVVLDDLADAGVDQENEKIIDIAKEDYNEVQQPKKSTADKLADNLQPEEATIEELFGDKEAGVRG